MRLGAYNHWLMMWLLSFMAIVDFMSGTSVAQQTMSPSSPFGEVMAGDGLPEVSLPQTQSTARNETTANSPSSPSQMANLPDESVSPQLSRNLLLGEFGYSLMFSREDMNNLRQVLAVYEKENQKETQLANEIPTDDSDLLAELLRAAQEGNEESASQEPEILPNFYLNSLIYEKPNQWTLWINRQRLSAGKPQNDKLGITVKSVDNERVTIAWQPDNMVMAYQRWQQYQEGSENRRNRHREAQHANVQLNEEEGVFTVSLRPNQTFAAESMQVLEGRYQLDFGSQAAANRAGNRNWEEVSGEQSIQNDVFSPTLDGSEASRMNERQAAEQLIDDIKQADQAVNQLY